MHNAPSGLSDIHKQVSDNKSLPHGKNTRRSECQSEMRLCMKDFNLRLPASVTIATVVMAVIDLSQECAIYF